MNRLILLTAVLLVGCNTPERPQAFLLMGQSNMVGSGRTDSLAAADTTLPAHVIYYRNTDAINPWDITRFGPELTLAQDLSTAMPDTPLRFIKHAIGGTSLLDWAPEWDSTRAAITGNQHVGPMYEHAMAIVDTLQAESEVVAIFWMQGERDARIPEAGVDYYANLEHLIASLRRDLGNPDIPFIMGRVNAPAERYPALEDVRNAQFRAAEELHHVILVDTDDLSKWPDNLHYDTHGVLEMGKRFAEAYLAWYANND